MIKTFFGQKEENYILSLKVLLGNKFVLVDTVKNKMLTAKTYLKWNKFNFDNYIVIANGRATVQITS